MNPILLYIISPLILLALSFWERMHPLYQYQADGSWYLRLFIYAGLGLITTALVGFIIAPYINESSALSKCLNSLPNWISGLAAYFLITFLSTGGISIVTIVILSGKYFTKFIAAPIDYKQLLPCMPTPQTSGPTCR